MAGQASGPTLQLRERDRRLVAPRTSDLTWRVHTDRMDKRRRTAHLYLKWYLADPLVWWLVPWGSFDTLYPVRHERGDLDLAGFGDTYWCPACTYADLQVLR